MNTTTTDDDLAAHMERRMQGPRVLICQASRDEGRLRRLNAYQIEKLADALDLLTAYETVHKQRFDTLTHKQQVNLLHIELLAFDRMVYDTRTPLDSPARWSELMWKYIQAMDKKDKNR